MIRPNAIQFITRTRLIPFLLLMAISADAILGGRKQCISAVRSSSPQFEPGRRPPDPEFEPDGTRTKPGLSWSGLYSAHSIQGCVRQPRSTGGDRPSEQLTTLDSTASMKNMEESL